MRIELPESPAIGDDTWIPLPNPLTQEALDDVNERALICGWRFVRMSLLGLQYRFTNGDPLYL